ncbi:head-tail connector protein [Sphingomonas turrisvirgatae]|uniref:PhiE125 gp8 family phage protein n=1 Tax=Sphingomonas turrisvirgatae TaxID=1888892 RepID=A0A1E3LW40_9SPHN|nr:hypothetical protein [Sphingomonas turrisvirgatae]ODP37030.1 hypothetical protein BFL28_19115 [Sphingomonas turrisvirgatae]
MDSPPFPQAAIAAAREAVRAELRIDGSGDDAAIERMAAAALALCEAFTGQALIAREWEQMLTPSREWQLLSPVPAIAIGGVEAVDVDAVGTAVPAGRYAIDIDAGGRGWVRIAAKEGEQRFRVQLTAGLCAGWDELPPPIMQGVTRMAAHLLEARDGSAPPAAVAALWRPWRRMRLSPERRA